VNEFGDFAEMRRRLEVVGKALEQGFAPSEEDELEILKARASALAEEKKDAGASETLDVVVFELARERYAFPLTQVGGVTLREGLTPVPCTPAFVLGIINLRGEIRTVIDLRTFFDLPPAGITELNQVLLIQDGGLQLGILADAIRGVVSVPVADLQPALPTLADLPADYVRGITSERLVVLEARKILSDPRILVNEEVSS
jgi:purine-binding chemotaxis protein CheW